MNLYRTKPRVNISEPFVPFTSISKFGDRYDKGTSLSFDEWAEQKKRISSENVNLL